MPFLLYQPIKDGKTLFIIFSECEIEIKNSSKSCSSTLEDDSTFACELKLDSVYKIKNVFIKHSTTNNTPETFQVISLEFCNIRNPPFQLNGKHGKWNSITLINSPISDVAKITAKSTAVSYLDIESYLSPDFRIFGCITGTTKNNTVLQNLGFYILQ